MSHIRRPMAVLSILLTVIIVAVSVLIVLLVLIQRPKQEGLGAAFGGGSLDSALGAHTTDVLQKITTWLGILFFVSAIGLAMVKARQFRDSPANNPLEGVQEREPEMPQLPPSISNLPATEPLNLDSPVLPAKKDQPKSDKAGEAPKGADTKGEAIPKAKANDAAKAKSAPKGVANGKGKAKEKAKKDAAKSDKGGE